MKVFRQPFPAQVSGTQSAPACQLPNPQRCGMIFARRPQVSLEKVGELHERLANEQASRGFLSGLGVTLGNLKGMTANAISLVIPFVNFQIIFGIAFVRRHMPFTSRFKGIECLASIESFVSFVFNCKLRHFFSPSPVSPRSGYQRLADKLIYTALRGIAQQLFSYFLDYFQLSGNFIHLFGRKDEVIA